MSTNHPAPRIPAIDGLRALAITEVVLFHLTGNYDEIYGHTSKPLFLLPHTGAGVHLSFMISGLVIRSMLDRTRGVAAFVKSRFLRLFPLFWAACIVVFFAARWAELPGRTVGWRDGALNLTMVPGFFGAPRIDGAHWTLEVEIGFYALAAIALAARARQHLDLFLGAVAALDCAGISIPGQPHLISHAYLFLAGVLVYEPPRRPGVIGWARRVMLGLVAAWSCVRDAQPNTPIVDAVLLASMYLAVRGRVPWPAVPPLRAVAGLSYPLFLVHQNLGYITIRAAEARGWDPNAAIAAALAVGAAAAVFLQLTVGRLSAAWKRPARPAPS